MMETLPRLSPDATRAERTRSICHQRLARQRARLAKREKQRRQIVIMERAALAGLAVAYLISMAGNLIRILR